MMSDLQIRAVLKVRVQGLGCIPASFDPAFHIVKLKPIAREVRENRF
jgi:hypothetical protein